MWQWQDWMAWLERAQGSLGRWLVDWLGGPLEVLSVMGVLAWALVVLLAVAAVLGALLMELRPWLPTTVDDQKMTEQEAEWARKTAEWEKTPMPLCGTLEPAPGHEPMTGPVRSRPRSRWLG